MGLLRNRIVFIFVCIIIVFISLKESLVFKIILCPKNRCVKCCEAAAYIICCPIYNVSVHQIIWIQWISLISSLLGKTNTTIPHPQIKKTDAWVHEILEHKKIHHQAQMFNILYLCFCQCLGENCTRRLSHGINNESLFYYVNYKTFQIE
jgi:CBS domain containing-hemolysin-like protein